MRRHRDHDRRDHDNDDAVCELLKIVVCQNEMILAKLDDRPCKLSPEDQKMTNDLFDTATNVLAKVARAEKP